MSLERSPETIETLEWEGVTVQISYDPDWSGLSEMGPTHHIAHIALDVLEPKGAPLPVTETGYRSHFVRPHDVEQAGGVIAFVRYWLETEARSPAWRRVEAKWRQLDLFR